MALHIDPGGNLQHDQAQNLVLTCPHCQVVAHITPTGVPRFTDLQAHKPKQVGIVYLCDACHAPIFLRFMVRIYGATRIELSPQFSEVERAREKFTFTYVPEPGELMFKEALRCFLAGAFNAFASMCRRTAQAAFAELGGSGKLRLFDELNHLRQLAEISAPTFLKLKSILFGSETDPKPDLPLLDSYEAGIVLEVVKDLLYEAFIRKGKLQQAMSMRRFFLDETATARTTDDGSAWGDAVG